MARPKKDGLDYFPVDVDFDDKIQAIELLHGNDGLVWIIKFWQTAYKNLIGSVDLSGLFAELFSNKCRITIDKHSEILKTAIIVGFCYENDDGSYTSDGIQKRISMVSNDRLKAIERQKKKRKEKKSKVKKTPGYSANNLKVKFNPPSFEEFKQYCKDNSHENIAERAYKGYSEANWHDSQGKPIKNWKQKLQHVWFKEDNKDKVEPMSRKEELRKAIDDERKKE